MYKEFDYVVSKVSELLLAKYSTKQIFTAFQSDSATLRNALAKKQIVYSVKTATEWLYEGRKYWSHTSYLSNRRTVFWIDEYVKNQAITTWTFKFENKTRFQRLPDWAKTLVEEYLVQFTHPGLKPKSIEEEKRIITNFLTFIASQIDSIEALTYRLLVKYFRQDSHKTLTTKQVYNVATRRFLCYLENKQLLSEGIHQLLKWNNFLYIIIVDELPEEQRALFQFFIYNKDKDNKKRNEKNFLNGMKILNSYLIENHYERTTCLVTIEVATLLHQFMRVNDLTYSPQMADTWLGLLKEKMRKEQFWTFRRSLKLLQSVMQTGYVGTDHFIYTPSVMVRVPSWCRNLVESYIAERTREEKSSSTIKGDLYACIRFLQFLDRNGVSMIKDLTPQIIMEFSLQDIHKTPSAKNCFNGKIRNFLHFLANQQLIPRSSVLAMTSNCATTVRIVKVLSPEQKQVILFYIKNSTTPMELRNAAMISLGLNLGLRACDIISLRFSDISFPNKTISLIQQKTGVPIQLPFSVGTGNSIYRYINEGRPQSDSPYVFVPHQNRNTQNRLKSCCACNKALENSLRNSGCEVVTSFHILRKTFASNLLAANNPISIIASALGHSGIQSVDPYLATNKRMMEFCSIGLIGIELQGGRL